MALMCYRLTLTRGAPQQIMLHNQLAAAAAAANQVPAMSAAYGGSMPGFGNSESIQVGLPHECVSCRDITVQDTWNISVIVFFTYAWVHVSAGARESGAVRASCPHNSGAVGHRPHNLS